MDLVHVPSFEEQLADPGTTFGAPGRFFSARELRWAQSRADQKGDGVAIHLAGVWAAKEAAVKAWVGALDRLRRRPLLTADGFPWVELQILHFASGSPFVSLSSRLRELLSSDLGALADAPEHSGEGERAPSFFLSITHDGDFAAAWAVLSGGDRSGDQEAHA